MSDDPDRPKPVQLPLLRTSGGAWHKVLEPGALAEGSVTGVTCAGRSLCLLREGGRVAALDDVCPHQGAPLSTGWVWEGNVVCAWHGWAFDAHTGRLAGARRGIGPTVVTHPVEERPDGIYVRLPEPR